MVDHVWNSGNVQEGAEVETASQSYRVSLMLNGVCLASPACCGQCSSKGDDVL